MKMKIECKNRVKFEQAQVERTTSVGSGEGEGGIVRVGVGGGGVGVRMRVRMRVGEGFAADFRRCTGEGLVDGTIRAMQAAGNSELRNFASG
jgi:hypothetical protein